VVSRASASGSSNGSRIFRALVAAGVMLGYSWLSSVNSTPSFVGSPTKDFGFNAFLATFSEESEIALLCTILVVYTAGAGLYHLG